MKRWLCGLAVALVAAGAQAASTGTYFKFDIGPNYLGEIRQEFVTSALERDLDMNVGVRASVAEGFVINRFLAVEVESGVIWNELDESTDWLLQVPLLVNILLRYECKGGWTAFAGVGGGGVAAIANSTVIDDDSDVDVVPAWQATAGLSYNVSANLSVGVVYKYLGIAEAEFELEIFGTVSEIFRVKDVHNHYAGFQMTYSF